MVARWEMKQHKNAINTPVKEFEIRWKLGKASVLLCTRDGRWTFAIRSRINKVDHEPALLGQVFPYEGKYEVMTAAAHALRKELDPYGARPQADKLMSRVYDALEESLFEQAP